MTQRSSLADEAFEVIHGAILDGTLALDRPLSETDLAELAGVSRTPVRSALQRLELEGYIERLGRGGLAVRRMTRSEIADVFLVRELVEGFGARLAAERISPEEIGRLRTLLRSDWLALRHSEIPELARVNEELHALILAASRNRALQDLVNNLRRRVAWVRAFAVGKPQDRTRFVEQHEQLVNLIEDGDSDRAEALARRHLRAARDVLLTDVPAETTSEQPSPAH
jgi:DNA-binding GntR family transcriptional regulator